MLMTLGWKGESRSMFTAASDIVQLAYRSVSFTQDYQFERKSISKRRLNSGWLEIEEELHVVASRPCGHEIVTRLRITNIQKSDV
jgi:hypothetical protein